MRATHHAINYSDACDKGGSGMCDGFMEDGEGNPNASMPGHCSCPCHRDEYLPETVKAVKDYHDDFHGVARG